MIDCEWSNCVFRLVSLHYHYCPNRFICIKSMRKYCETDRKSSNRSQNWFAISFVRKCVIRLFDGREFIFLDLLWSNSIPKWFDSVLSIHRRLTLKTSNTAFFFAYENEFKSIWPTEAFAFDFTFNPSCSKFFFRQNFFWYCFNLFQIEKMAIENIHRIIFEILSY